MKSYKVYIASIFLSSAILILYPGDNFKTILIFTMPILLSSIVMTIYMRKNFIPVAVNFESSLGFAIIVMLIMILCWTIIGRIISVDYRVYLICLASIYLPIFMLSLDLYGYIKTAGHIIPSGEKYHPYGSNITPLNMKESLKLLSEKTNIPVASLPEEAKQIAEECWHFRTALSITGNIVKQHSDHWGQVVSLLKKHDSNKYVLCAGQMPYTFKAVDIALEYFSEIEQDMFSKLSIFSSNEALVAATLSEYFGVPVESVISFFNNAISFSLLYSGDDDDVFMKENTFKYLQFNYKDTSSLQKEYLNIFGIVEDNPDLIRDVVKLRKDNYELWKSLFSHLALAGEWNIIFDLLTNFPLLENRCRFFDSRLRHDFEPSLQYWQGDKDKKEVIDIFSKALLQEHNSLKNYPKLLFPLIYPRLLSYNNDIVNEICEKEGSSRKSWLKSSIPNLTTVMWASTFQKQHYDAIFYVAVSPDGKQMVSAADDRSIILWDLTTGRPDYCFDRLPHAPFCLTTSGDWTMVAAGFHSGVVSIWDTQNGKRLKQIVVGNMTITSICFTPDGKYLFAGDHSGYIYRIDTNNWKTKKSKTTINSPILSMKSNKDGSILYCGLYTGHICTWDGDKLVTLPDRKFSGHDNKVTNLSITPDGKHLVSGSGDNTIRVWDAIDVNNKQTLRTIEGFKENVNALAISPDGSIIAGKSKGNTISLWNFYTAEIIGGFKVDKHNIQTITFAPDSKQLITGDEKGIIKFWKVSDARMLDLLDDNSPKITRLSALPKRNMVVSGHKDGSMIIHSDGAESILFDKSLDQSEVSNIIPTDNGAYFVAVCKDGRIYKYDVANNELNGLLKPGSMVNSVALSHDNKYMAVSLDNNVTKIYDFESGKEVNVPNFSDVYARSLQFSPDNYKLLTLTKDELCVWDIQTGSCISHIDSDAENWLRMTQTTDGNRVFIDTEEGDLLMYQLEDGQLLATIEVPSNVRRIASYPGSNTILLLSWDDCIYRFDMNTMQRELIYRRKGLDNLVIRQDKPLKAAATYNNEIIFLDWVGD